MAASDYLSSVKIGNDEYDIYAKSALSAGWVAASAISGDIPASAITGQISESSISSVPASALPEIPPSAITNNSIPWNALEPHTAGSGSDATNKLWTPCATREYVTDYVAGRISNVYKFQGSENPDDLNQMTGQDNGDVYNITGFGGVLNEGTVNEVVVAIGDNVAWVSAGGGWWDKLASTDTSAKLDTTAFTTWSSNSASEFSGSAASANTAWTTVNVSGSAGPVNGQDLISSAWSGASALEWISAFESSGQPVWVTQTYLSGSGTSASPIGLSTPASTIDTNTQTSALATVGAITSFVDNNYIAKTDIYVSADAHQLVIDNQ